MEKQHYDPLTSRHYYFSRRVHGMYFGFFFPDTVSRPTEIRTVSEIKVAATGWGAMYIHAYTMPRESNIFERIATEKYDSKTTPIKQSVRRPWEIGMCSKRTK